MFDASLRLSSPPDELRKMLEEMICFAGDGSRWPTEVQVVTATDSTGMDNWTRKRPEDFGWAYVAINGADYCEAVAVTVTRERERLSIREVEWGRP
jgi:hypothetical protein